METKVKVGILGGGFGGLYAVSYINKYLRRGIEVTLFDKNNYLLYPPSSMKWPRERSTPDMWWCRSEK